MPSNNQCLLGEYLPPPSAVSSSSAYTSYVPTLDFTDGFVVGNTTSNTAMVSVDSQQTDYDDRFESADQLNNLSELLSDELGLSTTDSNQCNADVCLSSSLKQNTDCVLLAADNASSRRLMAHPVETSHTVLTAQQNLPVDASCEQEQPFCYGVQYSSASDSWMGQDSLMTRSNKQLMTNYCSASMSSASNDRTNSGRYSNVGTVDVGDVITDFDFSEYVDAFDIPDISPLSTECIDALEIL
jgi:hypothetical protein